ncbi:nitrile hydratase [Caballeronia insecticola]|uniref:Nitrile hydratase n=1 Tax=Caballeronia insecticola TaxID=758793 RepID=R4WKY7_9BURK|nr:nitrile hydratase [Caballeronia insecticola]
MNAAHDMGGMQAFGPIEADACDAPGASPFHADWERRVLAVTLAMGATRQWNIDTSRAARESLPPAQYLNSSYYEIWFEGLKKLLIAKGLASEAEIATGRSQGAPLPDVIALKAANVSAALLRGAPVDRPATKPARFSIGDDVRTKLINPPTHTRLPATLLPRQAWPHRRCARHACFPRRKRARSRRASALALYGALRCRRALGAGHDCIVRMCGLLGALSRCRARMT